jgi:hypothetical protein
MRLFVYLTLPLCGSKSDLKHFENCCQQVFIYEPLPVVGLGLILGAKVQYKTKKA